jgi:hypothetical protein
MRLYCYDAVCVAEHRRGEGMFVAGGWIERRRLLRFLIVIVAAAVIPASGGAASAVAGSSVSVMHMEMPTKAAFVPYAAVLNPHGWMVSASSTAAGRSPRAVLGSRRSSFWQSARLGGRVHLPQSLTVTFSKGTVISGLTYVPHGKSGVIGRFVVRLSTDGKHFGRPVAYGRWQANSNLKRVGWVPRDVRAVELTVLSLASPGDHAVAVSRLVLAGALRSQPVDVPEGITAPTARPHDDLEQPIRRRRMGTDDRVPADPSGGRADPG